MRLCVRQRLLAGSLRRRRHLRRRACLCLLLQLQLLRRGVEVRKSLRATLQAQPNQRDGR